MAEIKGYDPNDVYGLASTYRAKAESLKGGGRELGMDDFLKLLAAQLANQDMMNPNTDTAFIAQMAQFSSLQSMDSLAKMTMINQSTSLVGKTVIVAAYDKAGKLQTDTGVVERVTVFGDTPKLIINGNEYAYENVMEIVNTAPKTEETKTEEGETTEPTEPVYPAEQKDPDDIANPVEP